MRWSVIPYEKFKAIDLGCRGFARFVAKCIQDGNEPDLRVLRVIREDSRPRWFIEVRAGTNHKQFAVDMSELETQAAIVPIYLADHVQSIRKELSELFGTSGFEEGVDMVMPFQFTLKHEEPS